MSSSIEGQTPLQEIEKALMMAENALQELQANFEATAGRIDKSMKELKDRKRNREGPRPDEARSLGINKRQNKADPDNKVAIKEDPVAPKKDPSESEMREEKREEETAPEKETKAPEKKKSSNKEKTPLDYLNERVAYFFGNEGNVYFGTIDKWNETTGYWHVSYDDDDEQEFNRKELKIILDLYREHRDDDPKIVEHTKQVKKEALEQAASKHT